MGASLAYDDSATELFVTAERAFYLTREFLADRLSSTGVDAIMKTVEITLAKTDPRGDRIGWDSLLTLLLDVYQDLKTKLTRLLGSPGPFFTLQEAKVLLSQKSHWREQQDAVLSEAGAEDDKVRLDALLSALVDLRVFREGDLAVS